MDLLNDVNLGTVADPYFEEDQYDMNERLLLEHDKTNFMELVDQSIGISDIKYYFENIKNEEISYWTTYLTLLIKKYYLNPLKNFITMDFEGSLDNSSRTKDLIIILKYTLKNLIITREIDRFITREELKNKIERGFYFDYVLDYIDKESFNSFLNVIFEIEKM